MAYDEELAARIRAQMDDPMGVSERKMFGGLVFLVHGNMCCGIVGADLMVRVGAEGYEKALAEPHVRPMDFTGKPLTGMVYVDATGIESDANLEAWLERGRTFVSTLPPKGARGAGSVRRTKAKKVEAKAAKGAKPPLGGRSRR
jgi:TfoX/Sxy family transcriptional regulator of competence genes